MDKFYFGPKFSKSFTFSSDRLAFFKMQVNGKTYLRLTTKTFPETIYGDVMHQQFVEIYDSAADWTINTICLLLNELQEWKVVDKVRTRCIDCMHHFVFHFADDANNEIFIDITSSASIQVKITTATVKREWFMLRSTIYSDIEAKIENSNLKERCWL